ncbi:XRE family transcriptional regulator [Streptomyces hainanensis]|uniref:XRE family transcriptional regulator n=2 Tax=Streptomyces hainanensis TaxID=402648 RepID=A0A4R4TEZ9_9ACTN|nr:XRE family transcriptional regulator [Streptomyces hainanensis]
MARAGLSVVDVAAQLEVDPKTVERWLAGRVPHPRSRARLSALMKLPESHMWPGASSPMRRRQLHGTEVQAVYPHRWQVPADVWRDFFRGAECAIDVLVYSGLFLVEDVAVLRVLSERATAGVKVRLLLGDLGSVNVATRGGEEGIGDAMAGRIRNALVLVRPLASLPHVEIRKHSTTLYNSIFRRDDELLVNAHVLGQPATHSPVLHLRRGVDCAMTCTYRQSFERVWSDSVTVTP